MGFWFVYLIGMARIRNIESDLDESFDKAIARLRDSNILWELGMGLLIQANWWDQFVLDGEKLLEAAQIFKKLEVPFEQGIVAELLGKYSFQQRRPIDEVTVFYEQARVFYQQMRGLARSGINMEHLVDIYFSQGEFDKGFTVYHEEQFEQEHRGNIRMLGQTLQWEALYAVRYSSYEHALRVRERALTWARDHGYQSDLAWQLLEKGEVHRIFGELENASRAYEGARELFEKMNLTLGLGYYERACGDLALHDGRYKDAMLHYQQFATLATTDNHTWSMVQAQAKISLIHAYLGNIQQARMEMKTALREIKKWRQDDLTLQALLTEPICLIHEGKLEEAVELASFMQNHQLSWNETKQQTRAMLEAIARDLSDEVVQSAIKRGNGLDFDSVIAGLIERRTE